MTAQHAVQGERLNKFLARSGVASRRSADVLIASGVVLVNGRRPPINGCLIDPEKDRVTVSGADVVAPPQKTYVALNKPVGFVVTADDPGDRPTVMKLVEAGARLFSVGRLDMDSHGLLVMTDDGELANRLTHPRYKVPRGYLVTVEGMPSEPTLRRLRRGIVTEKCPPAERGIRAAQTRSNLGHPAVRHHGQVERGSHSSRRQHRGDSRQHQRGAAHASEVHSIPPRLRSADSHFSRGDVPERVVPTVVARRL